MTRRLDLGPPLTPEEREELESLAGPQDKWNRALPRGPNRVDWERKRAQVILASFYGRDGKPVDGKAVGKWTRVNRNTVYTTVKLFRESRVDGLRRSGKSASLGRWLSEESSEPYLFTVKTGGREESKKIVRVPDKNNPSDGMSPESPEEAYAADRETLRLLVSSKTERQRAQQPASLKRILHKADSLLETGLLPALSREDLRGMRRLARDRPKPVDQKGARNVLHYLLGHGPGFLPWQDTYPVARNQGADLMMIESALRWLKLPSGIREEGKRFLRAHRGGRGTTVQFVKVSWGTCPRMAGVFSRPSEAESKEVADSLPTPSDPDRVRRRLGKFALMHVPPLLPRQEPGGNPPTNGLFAIAVAFSNEGSELDPGGSGRTSSAQECRRCLQSAAFLDVMNGIWPIIIQSTDHWEADPSDGILSFLEDTVRKAPEGIIEVYLHPKPTKPSRALISWTRKNQGVKLRWMRHEGVLGLREWLHIFEVLYLEAVAKHSNE